MTFNWFHYKELNPDLPINGIATEDDCINHYNIFGKNENRKIIYYSYTSKYPHAGAGKRIQF